MAKATTDSPTSTTRSRNSDPDAKSLLAHHPFFQNISERNWKQLEPYIRNVTCHVGKVLFRKDDIDSRLFLVVDGIVRIDSQSPDGKDAVFNLVKGGEFFGEISLLDGKPRTANATALTDCDLIVIERRDFVPILLDEPQLMKRLLEIICGRLRQTNEQVEDLMFLDLAGRLARTILKLVGDSEIPFRVQMTQRQLAQIAGLSREMVNKQLRIWSKERLVRLSREEITILNREKLEKIVIQ